MTLHEVKAQLRNGPYTPLGAYPLYLIADNNDGLRKKGPRFGIATRPGGAPRVCTRVHGAAAAEQPQYRIGRRVKLARASKKPPLRRGQVFGRNYLPQGKGRY